MLTTCPYKKELFCTQEKEKSNMHMAPRLMFSTEHYWDQTGLVFYTYQFKHKL